MTRNKTVKKLDVLIVQTTAMTFLRADTEKARDLLRLQGLNPVDVHGIAWADTMKLLEWVLACGLTFRCTGEEAGK